MYHCRNANEHTRQHINEYNYRSTYNMQHYHSKNIYFKGWITTIFKCTNDIIHLVIYTSINLDDRKDNTYSLFLYCKCSNILCTFYAMPQ